MRKTQGRWRRSSASPPNLPIGATGPEPRQGASPGRGAAARRLCAHECAQARAPLRRTRTRVRAACFATQLERSKELRRARPRGYARAAAFLVAACAAPGRCKRRAPHAAPGRRRNRPSQRPSGSNGCRAKGAAGRRRGARRWTRAVARPAGWACSPPYIPPARGERAACLWQSSLLAAPATRSSNGASSPRRMNREKCRSLINLKLI